MNPSDRIILSEKRISKLYNDVHEAGMKIRVDAIMKHPEWRKEIDNVFSDIIHACADSATKSVKQKLK